MQDQTPDTFNMCSIKISVASGKNGSREIFKQTKNGAPSYLFSNPLSKWELRANFAQRWARLGRCQTLRPYICVSRESGGRWIDRLTESLSSNKKALIMLTLQEVSLKS
jgi:hypothetical protein